MKRCIVRYMARKVLEDVVLPLIAFTLLMGSVVGILFGLVKLVAWLNMLDWFLLGLAGAVLFGICYSLWDLYREARQNCEGDR